MRTGRFNALVRMTTRHGRLIWSERTGSAITLVAFAMPVLLGFAGLGLDLSNWYSMRRTVQGVADAAAVGATYARLEDGPSVSQTALDAAALAEALRNGYVDANGNTLTVGLVNVPTGNITRMIEVTARMRAPLFFASLFVSDIFIAAGAASGTQWLGSQCVIALNPTAPGAITFGGTTAANIGCGVTSNSDASDAISIGGNATLVANPAQAYGDIDIFGGGTLVSDYPPLPFSPRVSDPMAAESMPSVPATCDYVSADASPGPPQTFNLAPAVAGGTVKICGDVIAQGDLTLAPGTYFIHNGDFEARSGGTITGAGVTIILTGDTPADVGTIHFNGGATVSLSASDSTLLPGVVLTQDASALPGSTNRLNGGSNLTLDGIVYIPSQHVEFEGGNNAINSCLQLIADTITFIGNSFLENDVTTCDNIGVTAAGTADGGQQQVVLVE